MFIHLRKSAHPLFYPVTLLLVLGASPQLLSQTNALQSHTLTASAAQSPSEASKVPVFDIISIRKAKNPQVLSGRPLGDGYSAEGMSIRWLIMQAYAIPTYQYIVGEPGWTKDARYDIQAKVSGSDVAALQTMDWKQRNAMVQQILTERFKLKIHREAINQPIYSLIVIKKGLLHESPPPADGKSPMGLGVRMHEGVRTTEGTGTMAELARTLGTYVGRVGVDNTRLAGRYDVKFNWVPNDTDDTSEADTAAPSIFTAIQEQLGLKLVPTTGPVECLVIDHVEPPTEN
jgi:uncharacterized protein (TIGR03435 family)